MARTRQTARMTSDRVETVVQCMAHMRDAHPDWDEARLASELQRRYRFLSRSIEAARARLR